MNTHHHPDNDATQPEHEHQEETAMTYWPTTPDDHGPAHASDQLYGDAETIHQQIRGMCQATNGWTIIPAPVLYEVLGNLAAAPLTQLFRQLSAGLAASADHCQLYENDPHRSPSTSICLAVGHLADAAHTARELTRHLDAAQQAIAGQGYHHRPHTTTPTEENDR
ncbi:MAG: hypothetical protein ACRCYU_15100 [Nocardioides sp.]